MKNRGSGHRTSDNVKLSEAKSGNCSFYYVLHNLLATYRWSAPPRLEIDTRAGHK